MDVKFVNAPDVKVDWGKNDHSKWGLCVNGMNHLIQIDKIN